MPMHTFVTEPLALGLLSTRTREQARYLTSDTFVCLQLTKELWPLLVVWYKETSTYFSARNWSRIFSTYANQSSR